MQHFSEMLGLQHLDLLHLRGRTVTGTEIQKIGNGTRQGAGEKETTKTGGDKKKNGAEWIEEVGTPERVGTNGNNGKLKKDKAD